MFVNNFVNVQRNRRIAETAHLLDAGSISIRIPPTIFSTLALSINVSLFFFGAIELCFGPKRIWYALAAAAAAAARCFN